MVNGVVAIKRAKIQKSIQKCAIVTPNSFPHLSRVKSNNKKNEPEFKIYTYVLVK